MDRDARLGLAALMGGEAPLTEFFTAWPERHFLVHASLDRLAGIHDEPAFRNIGALLSELRKHPDTRVRLWFKRSTDGSQDHVTVPAAEAARLYLGGNVTVVVDGVDRAFPAIAGAMARIQAELGIPPGILACNVYASPPGVGTRMHFDQQENFFVQLRGQKDWTIAPNREVSWPLNPYFGGLPSSDLRLYCPTIPAPAPADAVQVSLVPGSVLYVPRGYWHESNTKQHSLALTMTFTTISWAESALVELRRHLFAQPEWRVPVWIGAGGRPPPAGMAGRSQEMTGRLLKLLGAGFATAWQQTLEGDALVRRGRCRPWDVRQDDDQVTVIAGAHGEQSVCYRGPGTLYPMLQWIHSQEQPFLWSRALEAARLPQALEPRPLLKTLLEAAVLDPAAPDATV